MASASASYIQKMFKRVRTLDRPFEIKKSFKYDVFLSFSGEDTRKNFVDNLYHALKHKGIYTYRDDEEIKKGKKISDELIRSIEDSKFYIIVFSKNYASSSWCLDELVKIMECQKKTNEHTAYPVFYDVEPTEVRKQSGAVGEAFVKLEEKETAGRWRDALREAADLAGWELKNTFDGHEAKFIQKIVEEISLELRFINLRVDEKLVGMETRVKDVVSSLETDIDDIRMIGIKGMGGAGKTTLAKAVFDHISFTFEGSSFVENVRETSKNPMCGLKSLQKQVLSDVLNDTNITVNGVSDLKKITRGRKVLVVLDDVDDIGQLEALAGDPNWFKSGSRVIITTRDEQVLVAHKVNLILDVNLLSYEEAIRLFIRYAFGREIPNQEYENLSNQFVCYAAGLPLTIKVLGSFLCGKDELEWKDALERLKTIPLKKTMEILELSYNSLEEDHKEIFLDVACMLKGWEREEAIRALECRLFYARSGLRVLELKSLITVSGDGCLGMHDHIQEMGRNIVRRLHPVDPHKHSRLWIEEEIKDILVEDKGTEATICIKVRKVDPLIVMKGLRKMKELRSLDVICERKVGFGNFLDDVDLDYNDIGEDSQCQLPNGLQYLRWDGYPFICLPTKFQANNLVGLKMDFSNIDQLWERGEKKVLKKLRFIELRFCKLRSLDIGLFPNLERLVLEDCKKLVELHMSTKSSKLRYLYINGSDLSALDLEWAQNIETLEARRCYHLTEFRMPVESLTLKHLSLRCCKLKTVNLTRAKNLETLIIEDNDGLVELRFHSESLKLKHLSLQCCKLKTVNLLQAQNLETLNIKDNDDLVELHFPIEKLKRLGLRRCKIKTLNLTHARNLEALELLKCEELLELHMPIECLKLETIEVSYFKLRTLNLPDTRNLKWLDLMQCEDLEELHMSIESAKPKTMNIRCSRLRTLNLTGTWYLQNLALNQFEDLADHMPTEIHHMPIRIPGFETLNIRCSKLRTLNLTGTRNIKSLNLAQSEDLQELHMPIESHELKTINICCSKLITLNLSGTWNLERLYLEQCKDLVELRMPNESLSLISIYIRCSKLETLKLGLSPNLESLDLNDCFALNEISAPVGCLSGRIRFRPVWFNQGFCMVGSLAELHLKARPFGKCPLHPDNNLPKFHFECTYKELLPSSIRNIEKLISFGLCPCTNLVSLSGTICGLKRLRKLTIEGGIPEVPKEIEQLECLEELTLLSTNVEHLPDSICRLKHLKVLELKSCSFLKHLPEDLGRLECLEELSLLSTKIEHLPDSVCMLKHLQFLMLESCWFLKKLPEDLGRLECLEELRLTDCTSLRDIPNSICEMKRLKCLHLTKCTLVEKLPKEIGRLQCLDIFYIQGTGIMDPPDSIFELKGLRFYP